MVIKALGSMQGGGIINMLNSRTSILLWNFKGKQLDS